MKGKQTLKDNARMVIIYIGGTLMKKYVKPIIAIVILMVIAMAAYMLTSQRITYYNEGYVKARKGLYPDG